FQDPITPQLIADFNSDVNFVNNFTFAAGATSTSSLRNSPVNTDIPPTQPNPLPSPNLPNNPLVNMASANEMKTIFQNIFGIDPNNVNNGATLKDVLGNVQNAVNATTTAVDNLTQANTNRATGKIIDVPLFHRRDNEDPYEWCKIFEQAHDANGWPAGNNDARKIALAV